MQTENKEAKLFNLRVFKFHNCFLKLSRYKPKTRRLSFLILKSSYYKRKQGTEFESEFLKAAKANIEEDEHDGGVGIDPEIWLKLCKLKDLEEEVEELRKSNYNLHVEVIQRWGIEEVGGQR
ncbi:hypothetical protein L2E82_17545 [Cichorium intybus]|uniref:Uncharacterized protein n=1 Tax=Cichorium intybus TaxID=13427 RepID=A0ACB9F8I2_CICIN|nr:hypothetical protein L2E82_17545 [Cichorium intybus]